ncbi:uncharacterized [Tachysurus ichikawai]
MVVNTYVSGDMTTLFRCDERKSSGHSETTVLCSSPVVCGPLLLAWGSIPSLTGEGPLPEGYHTEPGFTRHQHQWKS